MDHNPYTVDSSSPEQKPDFKCESCGSIKFNRVKPLNTFSFAKDFQCVECREQIPAPVPLWGSLTMIVGGSLLFVAGAFYAVSTAVGGLYVGAVIGSAIGVFGFKFAISGFNSLSN